MNFRSVLHHNERCRADRSDGLRRRALHAAHVLEVGDARASGANAAARVDSLGEPRLIDGGVRVGEQRRFERRIAPRLCDERRAFHRLAVRHRVKELHLAAQLVSRHDTLAREQADRRGVQRGVRAVLVHLLGVRRLTIDRRLLDHRALLVRVARAIAVVMAFAFAVAVAACGITDAPHLARRRVARRERREK